MCRSSIHDFLIKSPKCEHHMHLEGALTPATLFKLAAKNHIRLDHRADPAFTSPDDLLARFDRFTSLDDFLHYYFIGMSCLIHASDFEDLAWDYFLQAKDANVVHAELFFDPSAHTSRGIRYDTIVQGFENACRKANEDLGISTLLIPCFLRHLPTQDSDELWNQISNDLRSRRLSGIGLSGSEKAFPPAGWKKYYQEAQALGIRRTAHAGEEGPVDYVHEALTELSIERVDHGIKIVDDIAIMHEVARKKILVTLCPLSNVKLRCVQKVEELPIRKFLHAGVHFSINSDDPAYFRSYIQDNYCAVQDAFNLGLEEWVTILQNAVAGSWCDTERKEELGKRITALAREHGVT